MQGMFVPFQFSNVTKLSFLESFIAHIFAGHSQFLPCWCKFSVLIGLCQLSTRRLGLLVWPRRAAPDPQLIIHEWLSIFLCTYRNETDGSQISIFWSEENFRFWSCRDGKRFNNFLINLSSLEILIVLNTRWHLWL